MASVFPANVEAIGATTPLSRLDLATPHIELFANGLAAVEHDGTAFWDYNGRVTRIIGLLGLSLLGHLGALAPVLAASIA